MLDYREIVVEIPAATSYTQNSSTGLHGVQSSNFILLTSAEHTYINP